MSDPKEIRADAKLKNLHAEALEDLWRFRNPEEGGEKLTLEAVAVEIPLRYGFTCSLSSLSEFYKWLRLRRRMENAAERATQARFALASDPGMTPDMLARVGQMVFTAETIEDGNVKAYVELVKLQLQAAKQDMELRKLKMLEDKAAQADAAAGVVTNGKLSEEEKAAELKRIFRMG